MTHAIKNEKYGRLLYLNTRTGDDEDDNPQKGYTVMCKLGVEEVPGLIRFRIPDHSKSLKLDQCMFLCTLEAEENYVPDNDYHSKIVSTLVVKILDSPLLTSFDVREYAFFTKFLTKLNYSSEAQEVEMFPSGHYDSRDVDADKLEKYLVKHNGYTLKHHRQKFAEPVWKNSPTKFKFKTGAEEIEYETLSYRYHVRTPIYHGLCRQPRVIPPHIATEFDIRLNKAPSCLLQSSEFQKCRIPIEKMKELLAGSHDYSDDLELEYRVLEHRIADECNCASLQTRTLEYEQIKVIGYHPVSKENLATMADKSNIGAEYPQNTWQPHIVRYKIPRVKQQKFGDKAYGLFWRRFNMDENKLPKLMDHMIEAVFCNASSDEKPITNKNNKHLAKIPFFNPRCFSKNEPGGRTSYTYTISTGSFPYMIIFSGLAHTRNAKFDFRTCPVKTSMNDPKFKICEFSIRINQTNVFRTPWRTPTQHYINFLQHNGRYDNKAIGGNVDFDQFQNEDWCVPMRFDDRKGNYGLIEVEVVFDRELDVNDTWDAIVFRVPTADLTLDNVRKEATIVYPQLAGTKRRREPDYLDLQNDGI
ncbi:Oidioi.mRNA.OKI2018_I69.chr1.g2762.t1.cds [Oikopleura dioica]|uniref:Oidioi.mRNA.OKI2018_I69.chr1.g2762.t1.cds n=1 Tax=Oikopleura dioica TaxID=34765 RepID=A0ABN7SS34_OIKDI|nr:Oidioi.mRNA.OKI2018_I69.chr1.g2762.t1.cds [Oikopleura dioica]